MESVDLRLQLGGSVCPNLLLSTYQQQAMVQMALQVIIMPQVLYKLACQLRVQNLATSAITSMLTL